MRARNRARRMNRSVSMRETSACRGVRAERRRGGAEHSWRDGRRLGRARATTTFHENVRLLARSIALERVRLTEICDRARSLVAGRDGRGTKSHLARDEFMHGYRARCSRNRRAAARHANRTVLTADDVKIGAKSILMRQFLDPPSLTDAHAVASAVNKRPLQKLSQSSRQSRPKRRSTFSTITGTSVRLARETRARLNWKKKPRPRNRPPPRRRLRETPSRAPSPSSPATAAYRAPRSDVPSRSTSNPPRTAPRRRPRAKISAISPSSWISTTTTTSSAFVSQNISFVSFRSVSDDGGDETDDRTPRRARDAPPHRAIARRERATRSSARERARRETRDRRRAVRSVPSPSIE